MGSIQIDIWKKIDEKLYMLKRKKKMVQENKFKKKKVTNLGFKYMSLNLLDKDGCTFPT